MATRRWLGDAVDVAQVDTITVALTWATADTVTMTINGKDIVVTVGATSTTDAVATAIKEAVNGDTITGDATRNTTGDLIPEFNEITATVASSVVTLTGDNAGRPFTLSVVESTAGDGTATEATATSPTGKNHFDNADNWSGNAVPVDSDDIVFDHGEVDCKYGLAQSAVSPLSTTVAMAYTGEIGLPETNADDSNNTYREYRNTYLALGVVGDAVTNTITIGGGEGTGSGRIKIDSGDAQAVLNVLDTGARSESGVPSFTWKGTHTSNVANITKGDVGIAILDGETATVATLRVGFDTNVEGDAAVICGDGVTLTNVDQAGGTVTIDSATTDIDLAAGTLTILSAAHTDIDITGGTCVYQSTGTITTVSVSKGILDKSGQIQAATITNAVQMFDGAALKDPFGSFTLSAGIKINKARLDDVTIDVGPDRTYTVA